MYASDNDCARWTHTYQLAHFALEWLKLEVRAEHVALVLCLEAPEGRLYIALAKQRFPAATGKM